MTAKDFIVYGSAVFMSAYGLISFIAGITGKDRAYWMTTRNFSNQDQKHPATLNTIAGFICAVCGILILSFY